MPKKPFYEKQWKAIIIIVLLLLFLNNTSFRKPAYISYFGGGIVAGQPTRFVFTCGNPEDLITSCNVGDRVIFTVEYAGTSGNAVYMEERTLKYSGSIGNNVDITFTPPLHPDPSIVGTTMTVTFAILTGGTWKVEDRIFDITFPQQPPPPSCTEGMKQTATCPNGKAYDSKVCENGQWTPIVYITDPCGVPSCTQNCDVWSACISGQQTRVCRAVSCDTYIEVQACSGGNACTQDTKQCPDSSYVGRDPSNNCQFKSCPSQCTTYTTPTCKQNEVLVTGTDSRGCSTQPYCKPTNSGCTHVDTTIKCEFGRAIDPKSGCPTNICNNAPPFKLTQEQMIMVLLLVIVAGGGTAIIAKKAKKKRRKRR